MIISEQPLSMAEAMRYLKEEKSSSEVAGFIKKFTKIKQEEARDLKEKIKKFDLMKLSDKDIVKIVDFTPENSDELNKVFANVSLDEDETKKILETIKEFK